MLEFTETGGAPKGGRTVHRTRLFATFKLAAPRIAIVWKRSAVHAAKKSSANANRIDLAVARKGLSSPDRP